jgi:leader peptidase (prepilin peptidase) / N-methyltransferase
MWIVLIVSVAAGFVVARVIVAEADAHRRDEPDRWWSPACAECGGPLSATMLRCAQNSHPQRRTNIVVLFALPILLAAMVFSVPTSWVWPAYAVFTVSMVLLTVTDLDTKLIPNRILGPSIISCAALLSIGWLFDRDAGSLVRSALGALAYFFAMYALALIARGGLGFGDVKLAFLIGMMTGFIGWGPVIVAGILGFIIGGVVSLVLLISRRMTRKDAIPFGPFMVAAGFVATIWGVSISEWYLR